MKIIGSIAFYLWLSVITPIFSLIACLVAPLPPLQRYRIIRLWSYLAIAALRICCNIRYRVIGRENIPSTPAVFLSRHESAWETIAYQNILPPQAFVLKRELLHIPFFGWGLRQMSPIAINRNTGRRALQEIKTQGCHHLKNGFHVVIFPEGTRLPPRQQQDYHPGGAWLAKQATVSAVPIAVNSGHCWHKNSFIKTPGIITVSIGKPINTTSLSVGDINQQAQQWIHGQLSALTSTQ